MAAGWEESFGKSHHVKRKKRNFKFLNVLLTNTRREKKLDFQLCHLVSLRRVTQLPILMPSPKRVAQKDWFPSTQEWDEFLDFSRMSIPQQDVVLKRLVENLLRNSGNHLILWLVITLSAGIFWNRRILVSLTLLALCAFFGQVFFTTATMADASLRLYDKNSCNDSVPISAKVVFPLNTHMSWVVFYLALTQALIFIFSTVISS